MKKIIYADNSATTQLDIEAFEKMKPYLLNEYGNPSQLYSFSKNPKKAIKESREIIAACIGAKPEEIYFTSGGTESDNWAIKGCALYQSEKNEIISTAFEHHAVLNSCKFVEQQGYNVQYLYPNSNGFIETDTLEKAVTDKTKLVSVMYANNEIGTIQQIKLLCDIAHKKGSLFHCDAVQVIGHIKINVSELNIDLLSASAHKFNGPKGVGFLYIKNGTNILPLSNGGSQENDMRAGTENVAAIVGMATALKNNCDNLEKNKDHISRLENLFLEEIEKTGIDYSINGCGEKLPGLLSISFAGITGESLLHRLDLMGICVSTGSACDSKNTQISHVLKSIGLNETVAMGTIRISFGKNNTEDDVFSIINSLKKILL